MDSKALIINFFKQLGEMLPGNAYIKDKEGIYLYHNKKMLDALKFNKLIDKSINTFTGKSDYDLFPKKTADEFQKNDQKVMDSGRECRFEEIAYLKKRVKRKYISHKKPLYDLNNKVHGVIGYSIEYTELKINGNYVSLSRREMQTLAAIYNGMTIKEIAVHLDLSPRTVEDYYGSLKTKLSCNSKKRLMELIHQLGLSSVLTYFYKCQ